MPYRPISTWIEEKIQLYGSQQFKAMCRSWQDRENDLHSKVMSDWFDCEKFRDEKEWLENDEYDMSIALLVNIRLVAALSEDGTLNGGNIQLSA